MHRSNKIHIHLLLKETEAIQVIERWSLKRQTEIQTDEPFNLSNDLPVPLGAREKCLSGRLWIKFCSINDRLV